MEGKGKKRGTHNCWKRHGRKFLSRFKITNFEIKEEEEASLLRLPA